MEEKEKITEQVIEKPALEGLRILGRMIAREIYNKSLKNKVVIEQDRDEKTLLQQRDKQSE